MGKQPLVLLLVSLCLHAQSLQGFSSRGENRRLSILIISNPFPGHLMPPSVLGEELVRRGHNVTLCTTPMSGSDLVYKLALRAGMTFVSAGEGYLSYSEFQAVFATVGLGNATEDDHWKVFNIHPDTSIRMGNFLDQDNITNYDMIIATERLAPVTACLSKKWGIPGIVLGTTHQHQLHLLPEWPFPPFYTKKRGSLRTSDDMTFTERMYAYLFITYSGLYNRFYKNRFEFVCPDPAVDYSYMNSYIGTRAPHIIPTALGFEYPRTMTPLTHYVGPMLSKQRQVLPTDLQQWLDSKPDGSVIMISMGSLAQLTHDQGRIIVSAIRLTNYSVVWSLREKNRDILEGLELDKDRYFLSKWLAQVAVLNHSAVRMAIVHGGMNGVHEAIAYGVPIIVIPFWNDQGDVAARLHNSGAGIQILRNQLSVETLWAAISRIHHGRCVFYE